MASRSRIPGAHLRRMPHGRYWWRAWSWVVLGLLLLIAYALAVIFGRGPVGHRLLDALKLFPQFPGSERDRPWPYIFARQLSAIALLVATIGVVAALLSERLAELRARFRRSHAVVCGLGETGLRNTLAFRARGDPTTCIELNARGDAIDEARRAGALVLHGDATQVSSLQNARVDRARYVVCSCPDDATNTKIASLVADLASRGGDDHVLGIHVQIDNPHLARLLRAPLASVGNARLHFFNMSNVWARALLDEAAEPYAHAAATPPQIVVLGTTSLGSAVVVEAARRWHGQMRSTGSEARAGIVLLGPTAAETAARLVKRYRAIPHVCELVPVTDALEPGDPLDLGSVEALSAVYACLDDQSVNLAVTLEAERVVPEETPVFLPARAAAEALGPLFTGSGHIHSVALSPQGTSLDLLHDQMADVVAQAAHEAYLTERRTQADFGSRPADRPWRELSDENLRATQAHGEGIIEQLRGVWYEIEPLYDWDEDPVKLTDEAVEAMAELEHARWSRDRLAAGWSYSPTRSDENKLQNLLVPWTELSAEARNIDRAMVEKRPAILAGVGFRLARDPAREKLARQLHESYVAARAATDENAPLAIPWDDLPEAARESNRAAVDHIAVKLARIGCRVVPRGIGSVERSSFSDEEVERMAILEHERWVAHKSAAGLTHGPRDSDAETHPSMVAWEELPNREREKDREVVRAIPDQLVSVGYAVVRDGATRRQT